MAEVIVALDLPGPEARHLLDRLPDARWVKVGPILFNREGPRLIRDLASRGLRVFLDSKWHDIPNTVAGAVEAAVECGAAMATVHTLGGAAMLREASKAGAGRLALVGVTVLTSHDSGSYARATGRPGVDLLDEARRLAREAVDAGLEGVVCSPLETVAIRDAIGPRPFLVVPGIRRPGDAAGDQARTATPADAVRRGATHLVVGRPILQAPDPAAAFREISEAAR